MKKTMICFAAVLILVSCSHSDEPFGKDENVKSDVTKSEFSNYVNYFQDGMEWICNEYATTDPYDQGPWLTKIWIDGEAEVDGVKALKVYKQNYVFDDAPRFVTYIRVDGDRVLFLNTKSATEWSLLYDFGLDNGDLEYFFTPACNWEWLPNKVPMRLLCKGVSEYPLNPDYIQMEVVDRSFDMIEMQEEGSEVDLDYMETGIWLKGLGSVDGPLSNIQFNVLGVSSILVEASLDGKVVFTNPNVEKAEVVKR